MRAKQSLVVIIAGLLSGCVNSTPVNPSFPISTDLARRVLSDAAAKPKPFARPLVIVDGFFDPFGNGADLTGDYRPYTCDDRIVGVPLGLLTNFDDFRKKIIRSVDKAFPSSDPNLTTDVDVIGISMGGIAARYAAINPAPGRRLRIHRLFTISSPHLGSVCLEGNPYHLITALEQVRHGSSLLDEINHSTDPSSRYPIYPYVCLGDRVVGEAFAAPPLRRVWWVSSSVFPDSHSWAGDDPRIRADIVRRLRDETPLATDPPAPLPQITVVRRARAK
jgi:pimeloyl-ACP methyl ester carboxylesterase